jgi:alkanesulfonate monooxygenase
VFAIFAEPLAETRARVDDFRRRAAVFGRRADFNMSLRPIMAETEGAAWGKAHRLLADVERKTGEAPQPSNHSSERLLGFAARADVHDERLWMRIARATGAPGNTSCLVGTPEQVADAVLQYYRLGIHSFLLRGFENPHDTIAIGRDLIPLIKAGAEAIDRQAEAAE